MKIFISVVLMLIFGSVAYAFYSTADIMYNTRHYSGVSVITRETAVEYIQEYQSDGNFTIPNGDPVELIYDFSTRDFIEDLNCEGFEDRNIAKLMFVMVVVTAILGPIGAITAAFSTS